MSISYKLAKALKDAGFPQRTPNSPSPRDRYCGYGLGFCYEGDDIYSPTLSELIEACPHREGTMQFILMSRTRQKGSWLAGYSVDGEFSPTQEIGSTPEEAVANLWLVLHKKE